MGSKSEPPYKAGESWEEFLAEHGIDRDKAEPIHEIHWLRAERIRLMLKVERHRMTEEERWASKYASAYFRRGGYPDTAAADAIRGYLDRTAPEAK